MVTADYFSVAGTTIEQGRPFSANEDHIGADAPVIVLSHSVWRQFFDGRPEILGSTIQLNGHDFLICGVAPKGFSGSNLLNPSDFWVPLSQYRKVFVAPQLVEQPNARFLNVFGRLESSSTPRALQAELEALQRRLITPQGLLAQDWLLSARILDSPSTSVFQQKVRRAGLSLLAITLALLLIAGLNVATLLAVKAQENVTQNALRLALGAPPRHLARQVALNSFALALVGGGLGLLLALTLRELLWNLRPSYMDERILSEGLSIPVLLFGICLTCIVGILASLGPYRRVLKQQPADLLKQEPTYRPSFGVHRSLMARGPILVQVALSTVILGLAAVFLSDLLQQQQIDPGFHSEGLLLATFDFQEHQLQGGQLADRQHSLRQQIEQLPGVRQVAIAENSVLGGFRVWREVRVSGSSSEEAVLAGSSSISQGFFQAVGIRLESGTDFSGSEAFDQQGVIISSVLAQSLFGEEPALGQSLMIDSDSNARTVLGVAASSAIMALDQPPPPFLYLPQSSQPTPRFTLHVHIGDPNFNAASLRKIIETHDPTLPLDEVVSIETRFAQALWAERLSTGLLTALALMTLFLAGLGVHSLAAAEVRWRTREIGIRMALGAPKYRVLRTTTARGLGVILLGLAIGTIGLVLAGHSLRGLLYDAGKIPPAVYICLPLLLLSLGIAGYAGPIKRALRIDPWRILRNG